MSDQQREILNILALNLPQMQKQLDVSRIGLFGSYARNEANPGSDIDILIEFKNKSTFNNFMGVQTLLENKFNQRIDLTTNNAIKSYLRPYIEQDLIYVS